MAYGYRKRYSTARRFVRRRPVYRRKWTGLKRSPYTYKRKSLRYGGGAKTNSALKVLRYLQLVNGKANMPKM